MARVRLLLLLVIGVGQCLCLSGCIAFYSYYPVKITVQDAETNTPIAGAEVGVYYLYVGWLNPPTPASAVTDQQGAAVLRTADFSVQEWTASAKGYLADSVPCGQVEPGQTMSFLLYREPSARITILVPNGYRGPVKIDLRPASQGVQDQIGKREFMFRASATGYVGIDATPLLRRFGVDINAAYEDGRPIPRQDDRIGALDPAFRRVDCGAFRELFVVGTEKDVQEIRAVIYTPIDGKPQTVEFNHAAFDALFEQRP